MIMLHDTLANQCKNFVLYQIIFPSKIRYEERILRKRLKVQIFKVSQLEAFCPFGVFLRQKRKKWVLFSRKMPKSGNLFWKNHPEYGYGS